MATIQSDSLRRNMGKASKQRKARAKERRGSDDDVKKTSYSALLEEPPADEDHEEQDEGHSVSKRSRVIVIGGGVSGLSTARSLIDCDDVDCEVKVLAYLFSPLHHQGSTSL